MCIKWAAPSEFGTYRLCEQRRFRRACASAQSRQNLCCSLIQAVSQEEPSDRKPDPWLLWMAGHAQLKFVMTECSKTQIRLMGLKYEDCISYGLWVMNSNARLFLLLLLQSIVRWGRKLDVPEKNHQTTRAHTHTWDKPSSACGWSGGFSLGTSIFAPPNEWRAVKPKMMLGWRLGWMVTDERTYGWMDEKLNTYIM